MAKVLYGILNWRDSFENTKEIFNQVPAESPTDIVIARRGKIKFNEKDDYKNVIKPVDNVGASKNQILKFAQENKYDYCFIIEDDVIIKDDTIFQRYLKMMETLKLNIIFYGYDNKNRVLGNVKPNPSMAITISEDIQIYLNRMACSSVLVFKIEPDMELFDEKLNVLELDELLWRMYKADKLQSYGFFPDIPLSWKSFENTGEKKVRQSNVELAKLDAQNINDKFTLDMNADKYLQYLQETFKKELA